MSEQGEATATLDSHRSEMEKRVSDVASEVLTKFRLEGTLCDVVIKVGHVEFNAHKIILCRCTSYFRALFTGPWATSKKQIYTIPGVSPEMMHLIINYAYTNSVPVTKDNVVEVLEAADQFLVTGIVQTCCFFLEDQLCLNNCISIWRLLNMYHCPELRHKVLLYILYHFELVCDSQEFLELPVQQLVAIIVNDHLKVKQENIVFEAVLRWINHLPDQRRGHMSALLSKMRIGLMTPDSFLNMMDNAMIKDNRECIPIFNDAMLALIDFRANRRSKYVCSSMMNRPRLPSAILLVTGGKDNVIYGTSLEAYDFQADCWVTVSTKGIRRAYHGAAVLNNFVYIIGGCTQQNYLNTVQKFDFVSCTWQVMASMNYCRCFVSVAVQNGCIYAMGGYSGQACCNTVECYKPETNQWTMVAPMREKRSGASSTTLNGKVYICGGFNGRYILCTAECYDPNTNWWTRISRMMTCRTGLGVAAYKGHIYAVGGSYGDTFLCSAEAYNPETNRWSPVPSMYSPRSHFGIAVVDDQLFVVGGYNGSNSLLTVERYDEEAGMWYRASHTEVSRSGLSCCVLYGLYNMVENLFPRGPLTLPQEDPSDPQPRPDTNPSTGIKFHF